MDFVLMKIESTIWTLSGILILLGLMLASWVNPAWSLLAAAVGLNLVLSPFAGFCVVEVILRKLGMSDQFNTKP